MRLLLVEDSTADAELTVELLHDGLPGCDVVVTARLSEAVAAVEAGDVDVALVDLALDAERLPHPRGLRWHPRVGGAVPARAHRRSHDDGLPAGGDGAAGARQRALTTGDPPTPCPQPCAYLR